MHIVWLVLLTGEIEAARFLRPHPQDGHGSESWGNGGKHNDGNWIGGNCGKQEHGGGGGGAQPQPPPKYYLNLNIIQKFYLETKMSS